MTEIIDSNLLDIFIGKQNVENIHLNEGDIYFDVSAPDRGMEKKSDSRRIGRSDLEDIEGFFASTLQSRPFAKHLLQILWIREFKFAMGSLKDEYVYDFIQGAFALYGIDLDDETIEYEFFELLDEGYLQETNLGFSLSSKGKRIAEEMLKVMKVPFSSHVELSPITVNEEVIAKITGGIIAALEKRLPLPISPIPRPAAEKPKQTRRTFSERRSAIREAVKEYYDNEWKGVTLGEIEKTFDLGKGALSKGYGKKLMEEYSGKNRNPKKPVSKSVSDDFVYNEKR